MTKFFDLFKKFKVSVDDLHQYIEAWHDDGKDMSVSESLGMTLDDFAIFTRYPERTEALREGTISDQRDGFFMSNLESEVTGISGVIVWIACGEYDLSRAEHGPRFEVTLGEKITNEGLNKAVIVKLSDPPVVIGEVPPELKEKIAIFAENNRILLWNYWHNNSIGTSELLAQIKPLGGGHS